MSFRNLQPRFRSVHDRSFWRHERYGKVPAQTSIQHGNPATRDQDDRDMADAAATVRADG